jgi:Ca2+-transporting ATPase
MIMDSLGALALATEPPRMELMDRKPFGRVAPLINRAMWRNILGISLYQLTICLVLQFAGSKLFRAGMSELDRSAIIFNTFVFMQFFSEINSRRIENQNVFGGILRSYMFIAILGLTVVIQVGMIFLVGGTRVGRSIKIGRVNWEGWVTSLVCGVFVLPWGYLVRLWPLDWSIGPLDDDPTHRSKLEKLLRLGRNRGQALALEEEEEAADVDDGPLPEDDGAGARADGSPAAGEISPAKMKLRVFVHAVAFVNKISRSVRESEERRQKEISSDSLPRAQDTAASGRKDGIADMETRDKWT